MASSVSNTPLVRLLAGERWALTWQFCALLAWAASDRIDPMVARALALLAWTSGVVLVLRLWRASRPSADRTPATPHLPGVYALPWPFFRAEISPQALVLLARKSTLARAWLTLTLIAVVSLLPVALLATHHGQAAGEVALARGLSAEAHIVRLRQGVDVQRMLPYTMTWTNSEVDAQGRVLHTVETGHPLRDARASVVLQEGQRLRVGSDRWEVGALRDDGGLRALHVQVRAAGVTTSVALAPGVPVALEHASGWRLALADASDPGVAWLVAQGEGHEVLARLTPDAFSVARGDASLPFELNWLERESRVNLVLFWTDSPLAWLAGAALWPVVGVVLLLALGTLRAPPIVVGRDGDHRLLVVAGSEAAARRRACDAIAAICGEGLATESRRVWEVPTPEVSAPEGLTSLRRGASAEPVGREAEREEAS